MNAAREYSWFERLIRKAGFLMVYLKTLVSGNLQRKRYKDLESFCLFVGYPRSGHSLVASLLDAHPDVVVSMEWGVLSYLATGYRKNQLFDAIIRNARQYHVRKENSWTGYSYKVEGMYQGRYRNIRVIGDKMGGRTSLIIKENPGLLKKLQHQTKLPLKLIHVIRNPYDVISTMTRRYLEKQGKWNEKPDPVFLSEFITGFFERVQAVQDLKREGAWPMLDVYHEKLILAPETELSRILEFMGVEKDPEYLSSCASIIYENPHRSRYLFNWPGNLVESVAEKNGRYPFLKDYSFDY